MIVRTLNKYFRFAGDGDTPKSLPPGMEYYVKESHVED